MNRREKLLTFIVGLLVLVIGVFWIGSSINDAFEKRAATKSQKLEQRKRQEFTLKHAILADREIKEYQARSLPSNLELARAQYEKWLANLLAKSEIATPKFGCKSKPKRKGDEPVTITWNVSGTGGLDQVSELLHAYYSLDTLHRMSSLKLVAIPESHDLQINFDTQAFVLANTEPDQKLDPERKSAWAQKHGRKEIAQIIERNILSRPNKAPQIAGVPTLKTTLGEMVEYRVEAEDANEFDELRFSLVDPPRGATLDERTGKLLWKPDAVGEYKLLAQVTDDGIPSHTATTAFTVSVVAPPPPAPPEPPKPTPPGVDEAMFTYATGNVRVNGKPQIWLTVRTSGETLKLSEGDSLKVGSVDGVVSKIGDRSFELTIGEEKREVRRGDPLVSSPKTDDSVN